MSSVSIQRNGDPLLGAQNPRAIPSFNHKRHYLLPVKSSAPKLKPSCRRLRDPSAAVSALDRSPQTLDAFQFNSLIQFYIRSSRFLWAIQLYPEMIYRTVFPNQYTFPLLLKACSLSFELSIGKQLHSHCLKLGFLVNLFVAVALMDMYMKNGEVQSGRRVFDGMSERDIVAWNALVTGYAQNGKPEEALLVYNRLRSSGSVVGQLSIASIIIACSQLHLLHQGKLIHSLVVKTGFDADTVIATALLEMYGNCDDIESAKQVFGEIETKDLISWNCLVSMCVQNGFDDDASRFFSGMQIFGVKPNGSSVAGILPALARSGTLKLGKSCHGFMIRNHLQSDEFAMTALLDVYAKSGDLAVAHKLFDSLIHKRSVVAWSTIIAGYGIHGQGIVALNLFQEMLASNIMPNHVTYVGVLLACAHSRLVDEGREHFDRMVRTHRIVPRPQHFECMIDLLARAGQFDEAMEVVKEMPMVPTPGVWGALLSGCRIHGNIKLAEYAAGRLFDLHHGDPGFYVLLSNTYASAGMWEEARRVRSLMRERGLRKEAGWSSIEIGRNVTSFISGDASHPDRVDIYNMILALLKETAAAEG
ncbi:Pentatricopeptide repeat-containing protein [Platanthera guangdongensis]|uniref:Pentatricopeptide repeat-containing protein n=1 Tax=Platanthera guangdongensis TaxID=2320717 RepID=A0ABR2M785_9ASPA